MEDGYGERCDQDLAWYLIFKPLLIPNLKVLLACRQSNRSKHETNLAVCPLRCQSVVSFHVHVNLVNQAIQKVRLFSNGELRQFSLFGVLLGEDTDFVAAHLSGGEVADTGTLVFCLRMALTIATITEYITKYLISLICILPDIISP